MIRNLLEGSAKDVLLDDGERKWTRAELIGGVEEIAFGLQAAGVRERVRVAVCDLEGYPLVVSLLAIRALGGMAAPLDARRNETQLRTLRPHYLLGEGPAPEGTSRLRWSSLHGRRLSLPEQTRRVPAWAMGTSGTEGSPKIVVLEAESVAHVTEAIYRVVPYEEGERVLCTLPLSHTYGLSQLWLCLKAKATLVLPPRRLLPGDLLSWLDGAQVFPTIAPALRVMLSGAVPKSRLRLVTLAGQATLPPDRQRFSEVLPETAFVSFYGLTEASTRVLWLPPSDFLAHPRATGIPIPGVQVWTDDSGELWVQGPNVASGYLDDPQGTRERFPNGVLRTGDLFELNDGRLCYRGRIDGMFKSFGEKIVPEEVEAALREHPQVDQCVVFPERHELTGEDRPVAKIVVRTTPPRFSDLVAFLRARLPPEAVPIRLDFVDEIPATPSGKVIRTVRQ